MVELSSKFILEKINNIENHSESSLKEKFGWEIINIKKLISERAKLEKNINELRKKRNEFAKEKKEKNIETIEIKKKILSIADEIRQIKEDIKNFFLKISNIPNISVPFKENRIIKDRTFNHEIKHSLTYDEILKKTGMIDEKRAIKLSGSKFSIYRGTGAELLFKLRNKMIEINRIDGYEEISPPCLVKEEALYNTGQLPKFREDLFAIEGGEYFLIPTSEVSLLNMYANENLNLDELPIMLTAYTPCFRLEAGALGKDNKGIIRLHQFNKVEIVSIVQPNQSYKKLEQMLNTACKILELLRISYRIILLSYEEMPFTSSKTYDIEV